MSKSKSIHSSQELSSSSCTSSSVSSDEETDAQDLKPIKDYLRNRRELASQLFKSVKPEKIRMMLPQTLKKMDLSELEEWCASELSGMSKKRILSILNGKPMVDSSNTSESDDSGPSLEIISDTEEWFSDEDLSKVEDEGLGQGKTKMKKDKNKLRGRAQVHEKNDAEKSKGKIKSNHKDKYPNKYKDVKVKTENEREPNKDKEGDSLLDLLELEMRARAIRALIRKEEDVIPGTSSSKSINKEASNSNSLNKTIQDDLQEKENCQRQLEKIISVQQGNIGEDEDVVLVVQPTPTIELLSSESEEEGHGGTRINKKLENERVIESEKNISSRENKSQGCISNRTVEFSKQVEASGGMSNKEKDASRHKVLTRVYNNNADHKSSPDSKKPDSSSEKRRKAKKKSHSKEHQKASSSVVESSKSEPHTGGRNTDSTTAGDTRSLGDNSKNVNINDESANSDLRTVSSSQSVKQKNNTPAQDMSRKTVPDEEKSTDLEEIIDLDDYCDDMEDMENYDNDKNKTTKSGETEPQKPRVESCPVQKPGSAETWASRYYQTDDVQNVIKESKIQSEIRKRLRERQRLSKLSKSPNSTSPSSCTPIVDTPVDKKTMGSVDEYLALKRTSAIGLNTVNNNGDVSLGQDQTPVAESGSASMPSEEGNTNKQILAANNINDDPTGVSKPNDAQININDQVNPG